MRISFLPVFLSTLILNQTAITCLANPIKEEVENIIPTGKDLQTELLALNADQKPVLKPKLKQEISVSDTALEKKIDNLTKQILLKEFEIERYGIHYNLEQGKQGRWKGWRYGAMGEANSSLGLAGGIISVVNRGSKLRDASHVNVKTQESANYIPAIGAIIGAGAAGMEFSINEFHSMKARMKGYSPGKARKRIKSGREEIERLLEKRAALVEEEAKIPELAARAKLDEAEQKVLKDLLRQTLMQFERFYLGKSSLLAFQQMQYLFDAAKNITSAIGYEYAYLSLARKRRIQNGRAGVMFAVSGGLYVMGPILSRLYAKMITKRHRNLLKPSTETSENMALSKLKKDRKNLEAIFKMAGYPEEKMEDFVDRSASIYALGEKTFEDEIRRGEEARDKAKLTATQNIGAGALVGGTKIAGGILFMIPGYNARFNTSGHRADRATNSNLFTASLISLPASAFAIADTLRINIQGEKTRQKLLKQGLHPTQLAKSRLEDLDRLEKIVRAM